jgi:hypothetical protein
VRDVAKHWISAFSSVVNSLDRIRFGIIASLFSLGIIPHLLAEKTTWNHFLYRETQQRAGNRSTGKETASVCGHPHRHIGVEAFIRVLLWVMSPREDRRVSQGTGQSNNLVYWNSGDSPVLAVQGTVLSRTGTVCEFKVPLGVGNNLRLEVTLRCNIED